MAVKSLSELKPPFIDKIWLRQKFVERDAQTGFVADPTLTAQKAREMMLADGIRLEDNAFSSEIVRLRYDEV